MDICLTGLSREPSEITQVTGCYMENTALQKMKVIICLSLFSSCRGSVQVVANMSPWPFSALLLPLTHFICLVFPVSRVSFKP